MADPYTPFGYATPRLMRPMGAPPGMPPTLSGVENMGVPAATPPPFGQRLMSAGQGVLNPLGLTPPDTTVMQSAGPTLTGQPLPEQPRRLSFQTGDPQSEAVGAILGGGPAFGWAQQGVRAAGRLATQAPRTTAGVVGGTALAAPAATQETGPAQQVQATREQIAALRKRQQELQKREAELVEPNAADKEAVRKVQRALVVKDDVVWGENTRAAAAKARQKASQDLEKVGRDIERQETRLGSAERAAAEEQAEQNQPLWRRVMRDWAGPAGMIAGAAAPAGWRSCLPGPPSRA